MLPSEISELPTDLPVRAFSTVGNFSFTTPSLGQISIPNSFASLLVFYILSYLLSKRMGCLSGCLVSSANVQKSFCEICSAFKWSFNEFEGDKLVSPSYSFTILGLPHRFLMKERLCQYIYFLNHLVWFYDGFKHFEFCFVCLLCFLCSMHYYMWSSLLTILQYILFLSNIMSLIFIFPLAL